MAWTETTRARCRQDELRYASDVTDGKWRLMEPFLPKARRVGRPRTTDLREVANAILYLGSDSIPWRALPKDIPPVSMVQGYFFARGKDFEAAI